MALARTVAHTYQIFVSTTETLVLPETTERFNLVIVNPTTDTCYIQLGDNPMSDVLWTYKLTRGSTVECGSWRGQVKAIFANTPGTILVTEEI